MATLRIYGDVMDIQTKETLIAEIEQFKKEALKMHIVQVLADTHERSSLFDHNINADGSVIWFKTQARQLWDFWQAAKAQAVPEGFVLVPKLLSDELADELAIDAFNNIQSMFDYEHRGSTATHREEIRLRWCKNKARDFQENYKAMIEAQEQSHE